MKVELGFRKTRSGLPSFAQQGRLVTVFESQGWKGIRMDGREIEQAKRQNVVHKGRHTLQSKVKSLNEETDQPVSFRKRAGGL